ncbi:alpha/beta fold hydrolase [bacterium AH-315-C07]|nr:alpha/beta fold hydrolase [bacterium AH-315-C07]
MSNPRVRKLRDFEEIILDNSRKERVQFKNFDIQTYRWGDSENRLVFLIHGWEGQAGNLAALVDLLLQKKYQVVAFDAPSHGKSSNGKTYMFEFAEFVSIMLKEYHPHAIISHSFGGVTTAAALRRNKDIHIKQWFLVTTPHNFKDRIKDISDFLGVTDRTINRLIKIIEIDTGESIEMLNMSEYCGNLTNVSEALIIHSKEDKVLSVNLSRKVHKDFPQSKLFELDDLGHYTILWSEELKEIISTNLN